MIPEQQQAEEAFAIFASQFGESDVYIRVLLEELFLELTKENSSNQTCDQP